MSQGGLPGRIKQAEAGEGLCAVVGRALRVCWLSERTPEVGTKVVEKMAISAPVGGKIRFHWANEAAGSPDFRTYFTFSLSQKLMRSFGFEILHVKCIV